MTWQQQLVCRILLIIARMVNQDETIADDLKHLANHISVRAPEA